MYRSPFVSSLLITAVLLTGCGGEAPIEDSRAPGRGPAASAAQAAPPTSAPAATSAKGTDARSADAEETDVVDSSADVPDARATDSPQTSPPPADAQNHNDDGSGGGTSDSGTEGLPGWPIESTPVHGAELWAAYVAVGAPGDPVLQQVLERVRQGWPGAGLGELGCDQGAAAALGRTPTEHAVAVYFATEQHITEFLRRWEAPFVGAVHVTTMCAD